MSILCNIIVTSFGSNIWNNSLFICYHTSNKIFSGSFTYFCLRFSDLHFWFFETTCRLFYFLRDKHQVYLNDWFLLGILLAYKHFICSSTSFTINEKLFNLFYITEYFSFFFITISWFFNSMLRWLQLSCFPPKIADNYTNKNMKYAQEWNVEIKSLHEWLNIREMTE